MLSNLLLILLTDYLSSHRFCCTWTHCSCLWGTWWYSLHGSPSRDENWSDYTCSFRWDNWFWGWSKNLRRWARSQIPKWKSKSHSLQFWLFSPTTSYSRNKNHVWFWSRTQAHWRWTKGKYWNCCQCTNFAHSSCVLSPTILWLWIPLIQPSV